MKIRAVTIPSRDDNGKRVLGQALYNMLQFLLFHSAQPKAMYLISTSEDNLAP